MNFIFCTDNITRSTFWSETAANTIYKICISLHWRNLLPPKQIQKIGVLSAHQRTPQTAPCPTVPPLKLTHTHQIEHRTIPRTTPCPTASPKNESKKSAKPHPWALYGPILEARTPIAKAIGGKKCIALKKTAFSSKSEFKKIWNAAPLKTKYLNTICLSSHTGFSSQQFASYIQLSLMTCNPQGRSTQMVLHLQLGVCTQQYHHGFLNKKQTIKNQLSQRIVTPGTTNQTHVWLYHLRFFRLEDSI